MRPGLLRDEAVTAGSSSAAAWRSRVFQTVTPLMTRLSASGTHREGDRAAWVCPVMMPASPEPLRNHAVEHRPGACLFDGNADFRQGGLLSLIEEPLRLLLIPHRILPGSTAAKPPASVTRPTSENRATTERAASPCFPMSTTAPASSALPSMTRHSPPLRTCPAPGGLQAGGVHLRGAPSSHRGRGAERLTLFG
jgi:hypothetical protein